MSPGSSISLGFLGRFGSTPGAVLKGIGKMNLPKLDSAMSNQSLTSNASAER